MIDLNIIKPNDLWYLVGLIATDGSLSIDGRHISITSKDEQILKDIKSAFKLKGAVGKKASGSNQEKIYSYLQIGDVRFYQYLLSLGLSPAKSLTLGEIIIDNNYFPDFLRGVIDGDGCIFTWQHPSNGSMQSSLRIASAAPIFSKWLFDKIKVFYNVPGQLIAYPAKLRKSPLYNLKYGKLASEIILKSCYYNGSLSNIRKVAQVNRLFATHDKVRKYTPGWRNW